jgi:type III restriction enzyme
LSNIQRIITSGTARSRNGGQRWLAIAYDKDLPEILTGDRTATSFLVKDPAAESGWRVDAAGRRSSKLLLIPKLRTAVDRWRDDSYPGASDVTQRLFAYWFEEDHEVAGFSVPFRYHFCQREAIETAVCLSR